MLQKKLHIPINLPLTLNDDIEVDETITNLIKSIQSCNKVGAKSTFKLYEDFFSKKTSKYIKNNLNFFLKKIIPIIFLSKHTNEGLYQLLRLIDNIVFNFSYIDTLKTNMFIYENLSKVLSFSGHITNVVSKDVKLLEILQPDYGFRLNGNKTFYKNSFEKIDTSNSNEEVLLDTLRRTHRILKFQILFAIINNDIDVKRAATEFSLLAEATIDFSLKVINKKNLVEHNILCKDFSIIAYGRFGTNSMTANSDVDLVFVYGGKFKRNIYISIFKQLIKILSTKTTEGYIYEVDTKLKPSGKFGPVACTYENFKKYHQIESFAWEKIALKKARVINDGTFSKKVRNLLDKLIALPISDSDITEEIHKMRINKNEGESISNDFKKNSSPNWFETKYVGGGQRDLEFLMYFYRNETDLIPRYEIDKNKLFCKKMENVFFKTDQIVNICFFDKKQSHLPIDAINILIKEVNVKDLGSLKSLINLGKIEIFKLLNRILESKLIK